MLQQEDAVTVIIGCLVEKAWLIAFQPEKGYHLPYFQGKCSTWTNAASDGCKMITGQDLPQPTLWKIIRVWQSDSLPYLTNAIFRLNLTSDMKSKTSLTQKHFRNNRRVKYFWLSVEEIGILVNENEFCGEIFCYISTPVDKEPDMQMILEIQQSSINNDTLVEIDKYSIIVNIMNMQNLKDTLLAGLRLKEKDQIYLYQEYLKTTFPFLFMGVHSLKRLSSRIGIDPNMAPDLLRAADSRDRKCINFRELLHIIAVLEPKTIHTGLGLESRVLFVFRYYDKNSDGILETKDIREIVEALLPTASNDQSLTTVTRNIGGEYRFFTLTNFHKHLKNIKYKEFYNVLVNPKSICEIISYLRKRALQSANNTERLPERADSYKNLAVCKDNKIDPDYVISNTCVYVGKGGVLGVDDLSSMSSAFYKSKEANDLTLNRSSYTMFDALQSCHVVLSSLKYFASDDHSALKPPYSWQQDKFEDFTMALKDVCYKLVDLMKKEPRMIEVNSPVYILGDIHGNYHDLFSFEQFFWGLGINLSPMSVLFLGDYVDRGEYSVEVVGYLFAQKLQNFRRVFLLRGNHEIRDVQKNFTFYSECLRKFDRLGKQMWETINNVFDCLPLAARIDNKIFCCHGGIPPPWLCPSINMINKIPCPLSKINEESILAWELLWNDPLKEGENVDMDTIDFQLSMNNGFAPNIRRGTGHAFSYEALMNFMKINNLTFVIRAHESQYTGFQGFHIDPWCHSEGFQHYSLRMLVFIYGMLLRNL
ncbi:uncharacterized protein LOC106669357 isoform X2 [Cimex lectularius]|uniref:EF-hand domain-containing protein n=1 Tax=Cimex lectularius TaxID=79782 RepID=A0A8I6SG04_CIMLE|nr:uncharacterized protein LOC106669357 isoform X2 [Cimex lectularius]